MAQRPDYDTQRVKAFMVEHDLAPMELVRLCGIAVSSAYIINRGEPLNDLNVLYKVYVGLKKAGFDVTWVQLTGIE